MNDFLIIGAGIIGLTIAYEIKQKHPQARITIIEKESEPGIHSSGRNSGVLHAGFYYTANSLKAKFTRDGNHMMKNYVKKNNLDINECGKVVVCQNEKELQSLYELKKRGDTNGVELTLINEQELQEIEPNAKTYKQALFSPSTATINPLQIVQHLANELKQIGVSIYFNEKYQKRIDKNKIQTTNNQYFGKTIINSAGLYADKIAKDFGLAEKYVIIPFKGIYLTYAGDDKPIKTNIYPVPNLGNPFLGVHYTVTVDNHIKIGPTAIPAFWRENYKGFQSFKFDELIQVMGWEAALFFTNAFGFRKLAYEEIAKYNKKHFTNLAAKLVKQMDMNNFTIWTRPGIRAQLLNTNTKELVQDFVVESKGNSIHVLNAVSPAFTSSFPFAKWLVKNYI